jgi:hypothetical protein
MVGREGRDEKEREEKDGRKEGKESSMTQNMLLLKKY